MPRNHTSHLPGVTMLAARPNYINFEAVVFLRLTTEALAAVERFFGTGPHFAFKAFIEVPYLDDSDYDKLMNSLKSVVEQFVVNKLDLHGDDVMIIRPIGDADDWEVWEEVTGYNHQSESDKSTIVNKGALFLPAFLTQQRDCEQQKETMKAMAKRVMSKYLESKMASRKSALH